MKTKAKEPMFNTILPKEELFGENKNWEDSQQYYNLNTEFKELEDFRTMTSDERIHLLRHMENSFMERGLCIEFIRNYGLADQAFREMK